MNEVYSKFVKWNSEQKEGYIETRFFTGGEVNFVNYIIQMAEKDPEFKKMLSEIGPKNSAFKRIHTFYRDNKKE